MLKDALCSKLGLCQDAIFLDSDNLLHLDTLLQHVRESRVFVVLLTRGYVTRGYCLLELAHAIERGRPLLLVSVTSQYDSRGTTLADLQQFLRTLALGDVDRETTAILTEGGRTVEQVSLTILRGLEAYANPAFTLAPDSSARVLGAQFAVVAAGVRSLLSPDANGTEDVVSPRQARSPAACELARRAKQWAVAVTYADDAQADVDASLALLPQMLGMGSEAIVDLKRSDSDDAIDCDVLLLFQSRGMLYDAAVLAHLNAHVRRNAPVVPVALQGGAAAFEFGEVRRALLDMEAALEGHEAGLAARVACRCQADLPELRATLAKVLRVISRPLASGQGSGNAKVRQAQLEEVAQAMAQAVRQRGDPTT